MAVQTEWKRILCTQAKNQRSLMTGSLQEEGGVQRQVEKKKTTDSCQGEIIKGQGKEHRDRTMGKKGMALNVMEKSDE